MKRDLNNLEYYWIVRKNVGNPDYQKILDYLNKKYNQTWQGILFDYYGYDGDAHSEHNGTNGFDYTSSFKNDPELLTTNEFIELLNKSKMKFPIELKSGMIAETLDGNYFLLVQFKNNFCAIGNTGHFTLSVKCFEDTENESIYITRISNQAFKYTHLAMPNKMKQAFDNQDYIIWQRKSNNIKLNNDYTATINKTNKVVEIGCQKIPFEAIEELYKAIK